MRLTQEKTLVREFKPFWGTPVLLAMVGDRYQAKGASRKSWITFHF